MGAVYRGRHAETGVDHAIKVILARQIGSGTAGSRAAARFKREVEVLARLDAHPGIVHVHACGVDGGRPWCAMQFVDGAPLSKRIAAGPLDPREASRIVSALADALAFAHEHGVVHRDLKPENVLIESASGQPRLVDFGLAFDVMSERLTATGAFLGTPAFMAPEQVSRGSRSGSGSGERDEIGPAADVYGLGAILYACLTGLPPFTGKGHLEVVAAVVENPPIRPSSHRADLPGAMDAICLKALAKSPPERYRSAKALAADLDRFLAGESVEARAPGRLQSAFRFWRPKTTAGKAASALAMLALLVAATAGILGASGISLRAPPDERIAELEEAIGRTGVLDPDEAGDLVDLTEEPIDDPKLLRRVRLLGLVHAITSSDAPSVDAARDRSLELARELRPDGAIDRPSFDRAVRALSQAKRFGPLNLVLHGVDPVGALPLADAAPLARAIAAAPAEDLLFGLPENAAAVRGLVKAPGLSGRERGVLLTRHADALLALGDPARFDDALDAALTAMLEHGVPPVRGSWPEAFATHARSRFAALLAERPEDGGGILDLLVAAAGNADRGPDAPFIGKLQMKILLDSGALSGGSTRDASTSDFERVILATALLDRYGVSMLSSVSRERFQDGVGHERMLERARLELRRPAERRNPAVLVSLALFLISPDRDAPYYPEVEKTARAAIEAALETGIDQRWLRFHAAYLFWNMGDAASALEQAERALELEEPLPLDRRWPDLYGSASHWFGTRTAATTGRLDFERCVELARMAGLVQRAVKPWVDDLLANGAMNGGVYDEAEDIAARLLDVALELAFIGRPRCCDGDEGRRATVGELTDLALELDPKRVDGAKHRRILLQHPQTHR